MCGIGGIITLGVEKYREEIERMVSALRHPSVYELQRSVLGDSRRKIFDVLSFEGARSLVEHNNQNTWVLLVLALWMEKHSFSWRTA